MSRLTRTVIALTIAVAGTAALAGTAAADPSSTCTHDLVCAPINAPLVDVDGPLLTGPLLGGLGL